MPRATLSALTLAVGLTVTTFPAHAQPVGAPALNPPRVLATKDPMAATAGAYKLDPEHASVIARVGHNGGFSFSAVRFAITGGTLAWNPAAIEAAKLAVTVDTKVITAPIVYSSDPGGPRFLDNAAFPTATFVSTGVRRTGPTSGTVSGDLTLHGVTKPVTIDAQMVGAGPNRQSGISVGFTGVMRIKRSDFGITYILGSVGDDIELVLDAEFNRIG